MNDKLKVRKRPKSLRAMTIRLAAGTLAVWLVCMVCMTITAAQILFDEFVGRISDFQESVIQWMEYRYDEDIPKKEAETPGYLENGMLETLNNHDGNSWWAVRRYGEEDGWEIDLLRDAATPMQKAIIMEDGQGNILHTSGDFLSFYYYTKEKWEQPGDPEGLDGYAWIDLSDVEDPRYQFFRGEYSTTGMGDFFSLIRNMRITGVMDGNRMEPLKMDFKEVQMRLSENMYLKYDLTDTDDGWTNLFDHTDTSEMQGELVTIYTGYPYMSVYDPGKPVGPWKNQLYWEEFEENHIALGWTDSQKREYANLLELLDTMRQTNGSEGWGYNYYRQMRMDDLIVLDKWSFRQDYSDPNWGEYDFNMYTAFRVSPLWTAVSLLRNVYIGTFLLALVVFWRLRKRFRKNLIRPVTAVNEAMEKQYRNLPEYQEKPPAWPEYAALITNYKALYDKLRSQENEVNRLKMALNYAKAAEAKRRQMTSNIAHELKTPLAVVHSYAEGLQEHIAEEKREQYLQTILSETERMDTMVLEMLDLSRLEAGKVKLARDDFDLAALAKSVFEALAIKAEEKRLEVTLEPDTPVMVSADEGRIRQVLENYASNAVKYTPEGGKVTAKIRQEGGKTTFLLENESAPLPTEALIKVWDSFYRVDDSRTGRSGTGLGLAIAKSIVELHGGSVDVRNTKTGVEFRFTI